MKINITFRQLEAFVALARVLNFSEAAKAVHMSQPALSAAIRKLEEMLGATLFDRTTRIVSLTPIGSELYDVATRLLEDFDGSLVGISDLARGKRGSLSISSAPSLAGTFLPEVIYPFQQKFPDIVFKVHDALSEISIDLLKAGTVELALVPAKRHDEDLIHHDLFEDHLVVVCRPDHDLAGHKEVSWAQLLPYRLVAVRGNSNIQILIEAEYLHQGGKFQPTYEVEQTSTLIGFISNNLGVAILPASRVSLIRSLNLVAVKLVSPEIRRPICVVHMKSRSLSTVAQAFIEHCQRHAIEYRR